MLTTAPWSIYIFYSRHAAKKKIVNWPSLKSGKESTLALLPMFCLFCFPRLQLPAILWLIIDDKSWLAAQRGSTEFKEWWLKQLRTIKRPNMLCLGNPKKQMYLQSFNKHPLCRLTAITSIPSNCADPKKLSLWGWALCIWKTLSYAHYCSEN